MATLETESLVKRVKKPEERRDLILKALGDGARVTATLLAADLGVSRQIIVSDIAILRNIIEFHHEYLDGSGYPKGLRGADIPIEARIATIADIFDALTSRRPYKEAWPIEKAMDELARMADDGKLDALGVGALQLCAAEARAIRDKYLGT